MNKYIKSIVGAILAFAAVVSVQAQSVPAVQVETETSEHASLVVGAESQYVFRGQIQSRAIATANATVNLPYELYVNAIGYTGLTSDNKKGINEVDATVGIDHAIDKAAHALAGFTVYAYPQAPATNRTYEAYTGLTYDAFLNPTVIAYWDFTKQQLSAEASLHQDFKVPTTKKLYIRPAVYVGNVHAVRTLPELTKNVTDSYYYGTATVDLVLKLNKYFEASVGGRYNYLDNTVTSKKAWYGASITAKF